MEIGSSTLDIHVSLPKIKVTSIFTDPWNDYGNLKWYKWKYEIMYLFIFEVERREVAWHDLRHLFDSLLVPTDTVCFMQVSGSVVKDDANNVAYVINADHV